MSAPLLALYAAVRGLIYVALLLLVGGQCARILIARTLGDEPEAGPAVRDRARQLASRVALPLLALIVLRGVLQVRSLLDPGDPITADVARTVLVSSAWGQAWLLQLAAAAVLFGARSLRATRGGASSLPGGVILAVLIWSQTGMGHAATNRWPAPLGRVLDGVHLLGAGVWLGTLAVLTVAAIPVLRREARLPALARLVRMFSFCARAGVTLVLLSGGVAALVYAGSIPLLLASTWGRLLLVKLAGMVGVLILGWYNWRVVTPALEGADPKAREQLRNAVRVELFLALVMLAITTLLVVSPLPGEA